MALLDCFLLCFCDLIFRLEKSAFAASGHNIHRPAIMACTKVDPMYLQNHELVSDEFVCNICQNIMQIPTSGCKIGHTFCRDCYETWLTHNSSCPKCRNVVDLDNLWFNLPISNMISELPMQCMYHTDGCKWTGKLSSMEAHVAICAYSCFVSCPTCDITIQLPLLEQHIKAQHAEQSVSELQATIIKKQNETIVAQRTQISDIFRPGTQFLYDIRFFEKPKDGAVADFVQSTRNYIHDENMVIASFKMMALILYSASKENADLYRKLIVGARGIQLAYDCIEKHAENFELIVVVTKCTGNISGYPVTDQDKTTILTKGVKLLLSLLKKYNGVATYLEIMILRTIRNHLEIKGLGCKVQELGGLDIILQCNLRNRHRIGVQRTTKERMLDTEIWFILGNIALTHTPAKQIIFDHGVLQRAQETLNNMLGPAGSIYTAVDFEGMIWFLSKMTCACYDPMCGCKAELMNQFIAREHIMDQVLQIAFQVRFQANAKIQTRAVRLIGNMVNIVQRNSELSRDCDYVNLFSKSKRVLDPLCAGMFEEAITRSSKVVSEHIQQIEEKWSTNPPSKMPRRT